LAGELLLTGEVEALAAEFPGAAGVAGAAGAMTACDLFVAGWPPLAGEVEALAAEFPGAAGVAGAAGAMTACDVFGAGWPHPAAHKGIAKIRAQVGDRLRARVDALPAASWALPNTLASTGRPRPWSPP
jgi:hypothetical protein